MDNCIKAAPDIVDTARQSRLGKSNAMDKALPYLVPECFQSNAQLCGKAISILLKKKRWKRSLDHKVWRWEAISLTIFWEVLIINHRCVRSKSSSWSQIAIYLAGWRRRRAGCDKDCWRLFNVHCHTGCFPSRSLHVLNATYSSSVVSRAKKQSVSLITFAGIKKTAWSFLHPAVTLLRIASIRAEGMIQEVASSWSLELSLAAKEAYRKVLVGVNSV